MSIGCTISSCPIELTQMLCCTPLAFWQIVATDESNFSFNIIEAASDFFVLIVFSSGPPPPLPLHQVNCKLQRTPEKKANKKTGKTTNE